MPCCLTVIFCDYPKKKCRFLRYGKLMFPIADDSQFLRPADCVFFEICRDKVAAYNAAFHMKDLHACARHVDEDEHADILQVETHLVGD